MITITKTKALELIKNSRNRFFTVMFITKENEERKMNCQYNSKLPPTDLGYVRVKEAIKQRNTPDDCIRNINLQTLKYLYINRLKYKIK